MEPNTLLVVKLEVQQWNIVLAGVGKLPYEIVASLVPLILEQLQAPQASMPATLNGAHPATPEDRPGL
jgi:hypothetical protein